MKKSSRHVDVLGAGIKKKEKRWQGQIQIWMFFGSVVDCYLIAAAPGWMRFRFSPTMTHTLTHTHTRICALWKPAKVRSLNLHHPQSWDMAMSMHTECTQMSTRLSWKQLETQRHIFVCVGVCVCTFQAIIFQWTVRHLGLYESKGTWVSQGNTVYICYA